MPIVSKLLPLEFLARNFGKMNPIVFWDAPVGNLAGRMLYEFLRQEHPKSSCAVMSGGDFVRKFVWAILKGDKQGFRSRLRSNKLLLIEDVDALKNTTAYAQAEFYSMLIEMSTHGNQVIITAVQHPRQIGFIEELETMCLGGLVLKVR